mmetsp:Transcript_3690/g.8810  ORF Transcript_3690/g.8810 Transcript_3690/m.8810 type:complete len:204 (+) Transcript_3690:1263-1874(+)
MRPVLGSACGWAVKALPPIPIADSSTCGRPAEMNMPGFNLPSKSTSPRQSSVTGSNSTGRPASYSAYTLPPHAMMLVLARFFCLRSMALASGPPSRMVPNVPRYTTASAASSSTNSLVRTNLLRNLTAPPAAAGNSKRRQYPSPSSMWLYSAPPRSNSAGPLRYSTPPASDAGTVPSTSSMSYSYSPCTDLYAYDQSACEYTQ